jgi:predicted RNA-binding Zn-ribbon protein involved in translation (DUF1610 family)
VVGKTSLDPLIATSAVKSSRLLIEFQCPQCGAPATLEETDHLFSCEFCRVNSYLLSRVYRYVLPHSAGKDKELLFFPYWRFKGMFFSCVPSGINHRIVDISYPAVDSEYFPTSLGLRSQTLKLRFLTPDMEGYFLDTSLPQQEMMQVVEQRYNASLPKPVYHWDFIGESLSQIYSPFYVDGKVYDAVLNRAVSPSLPGDFQTTTLPGGPPQWSLRFVPALCPSCGWDLKGQRDSLALNCDNCNSVWYPGKEKLKKLKFAYLPEEGDHITYLPFYRIQADVSGLELNSYADLIKVANLPKVVQKDWEDRPIQFWAPAFKVRPTDFLRFARNLTLSQPQGKWEHEFPKAQIYPVTMPLTEAIESLKLSLASFMKPQRVLFPRLQETKIRPKNFLLLFIPFHERAYELTQPAFRLRINKNLLRYARHL